MSGEKKKFFDGGSLYLIYVALILLALFALDTVANVFFCF